MQLKELEEMYYNAVEKYMMSAYEMMAKSSGIGKEAFWMALDENIEEYGSSVPAIISGMVLQQIPIEDSVEAYQLEDNINIHEVFTTVIQQLKDREVH